MADGPPARKRLPGLLLFLLVGTLAVVPVLYVVLFSFSTSAVGVGLDFSTDPWARAFSDSGTLRAIVTSFVLAIRVPIAIVVAFGLAWTLVRYDIPGRRYIVYALWFSFFLPILPMAMGWILLADSEFGLLNEVAQVFPLVDGPVLDITSVPGIIWVHLSLSTVPIMTILLLPAMRQLDASFEEASEITGARKLSTLRRITLPLVAPTVLIAFIAGLIKSLEVFEVEQLLGVPSGIDVYSTRIYALIRNVPADYPQAMVLSTFFLLVLLVIALIYQRAFRRRSVATIGARGVNLRRHRPRWAGAFSAAIFAVLAITVGQPFIVLLLGSFNKIFGFFFMDSPWTVSHWARVVTNPTFLESLGNSVLVSFGAATIGTIAYSVLGWILARTEVWGREAIGLIIWLPWAIPGLLLSTAFLSLFLNVPALTPLLTTLVPLGVVLIVQSMPLGTHLLRSSITQVSGQLEEASYTSGAGRLVTFRRITLPLVMPTFISVFVLVFMTAMKDISGTVLLAKPGTRTLPLLMFEFASSGTGMESAVVIGVITSVLALAITATAFGLGARFSLEA
jgi:iron(III) transport system permease protein